MKLYEIVSKLQYGVQWEALDVINGKKLCSGRAKICSSQSTEKRISKYRDCEIWAMTTVLNCQKGDKWRLIKNVTPVLCIFIYP